MRLLTKCPHCRREIEYILEGGEPVDWQPDPECECEITMDEEIVMLAEAEIVYPEPKEG